MADARRPDPHDPSGFVYLPDLVPDALQEMRYATAFNFTGTRVDGYDLPLALMTRPAAEAVRRAAERFRKQGCVIRVFDAYRPQRATEHFLRWLRDAGDTRMKPWFYPELDKSALIREDFIGPRSAHSRGSVIDLTLADMETGLDLDMGGPFDYFGPRSTAAFEPYLTDGQRENRRRLREVMAEEGFRPLNSEWWHFHYIDEPYPDTWFDFPIDANTLGRLDSIREEQFK